MTPLTPEDRDIILTQMRALMVTDIRATMREEMRMFRPIEPLYSDGDAPLQVPGIGPIVLKDLREAEIERDKWKLIAENVKAEREQLRIDLAQSEQRNAEMEREIRVFKLATGIQGKSMFVTDTEYVREMWARLDQHLKFLGQQEKS